MYVEMYHGGNRESYQIAPSKDAKPGKRLKAFVIGDAWRRLIYHLLITENLSSLGQMMLADICKNVDCHAIGWWYQVGQVLQLRSTLVCACLRLD